jgi:hypothetical protein
MLSTYTCNINIILFKYNIWTKQRQEVLLEVSKVDESWGMQEIEFLAEAEPASPQNSVLQTIIWAD